MRTYNRWARVRRPNDPAAYARRVLVTGTAVALDQAGASLGSHPVEPCP